MLRAPGFSSDGHTCICRAGAEGSGLGASRAVRVVISGSPQPLRSLSCGRWPSLLCPSPAGPLPAPLLVLCPSQAELDRWLYHLEKQIALVGGVPRCHPAPPQVSAGNPTPLSTPTLLLLPLTPFYQGPPENELPWTLQHRLTPLRTASGLQVVGTAVCASRVKLQHLPSQVGGGAQRWEEAGEGCRQQVGALGVCWWRPYSAL